MKISEVNCKKVLASVTPLRETNCGYSYDDIEKIVYETEFDEPKKSDIAFIFGNADLYKYRVDAGIELYAKEQVSKFLVSGGVGITNKDRINSEASKMRNYLLQRGIPDRDIIVEDSSRDTIQNIKNSFQKLDLSGYDYHKIKYVLISSDFHIRRCFGLFSNILGDSENLSMKTAVDGITDINSWKNSFYGKRLILTEALALCLYARKGLIEDIDIPDLQQPSKRIALK